MEIAKSKVIVPKDWAKVTIEDSVNVSLENCWDFSFHLNLEDIDTAGRDSGVPKIEKTEAVQGNFSKLGDSRRIYLQNGQTFLETIIQLEKPHSFAYELSELETDLEKLATRARGHFRYSRVSGDMTKVTWTYGFSQKNDAAKSSLENYIQTTHSVWMKDTLTEMKRQMEEIAFNSRISV